MPTLDEISAVPSLKWDLGIGYYIAENPHPFISKCKVSTTPGNFSRYSFFIHFKGGAIERVDNFENTDVALQTCNYCYREIIATLNKALPEPIMMAEFDAEVGATVVAAISDNERIIRDAFAHLKNLTAKEKELIWELSVKN